MLASTGCDALMVARGGYGNPWLVRQILDRLDGLPIRQPTPGERLAVAREHLDLFLAIYGPARTVAHMRKHLGWYTRGIEHAAHFRLRLNQTGTIEALRDLLRDFAAEAA